MISGIMVHSTEKMIFFLKNVIMDNQTNRRDKLKTFSDIKKLSEIVSYPNKARHSIIQGLPEKTRQIIIDYIIESKL